MSTDIKKLSELTKLKEHDLEHLTKTIANHNDEKFNYKEILKPTFYI